MRYSLLLSLFFSIAAFADTIGQIQTGSTVTLWSDYVINANSKQISEQFWVGKSYQVTCDLAFASTSPKVTVILRGEVFTVLAAHDSSSNGNYDGWISISRTAGEGIRVACSDSVGVPISIHDFEEYLDQLFHGDLESPNGF